MHKLLIRICLALLLVDIGVKWYTHHYIPSLEGGSFFYPYGGVAVFQDFLGVDFSLNYAKNTGAAWGAFGNFQKPLLIVRMIIMACLVVYLARKKISLSRRWALSLILTGALGNILDYFLYGHVVDMFYFVLWKYSFPVFNVADSLIFCGICLIFLQNTLEKRYPLLARLV